MGALLLLRIKMKWVTSLSLMMMIVFMLTTLYDALYSPVSDCGCFGDALVISNWQTFYKNLIIIVFILMVFLRRSDFKVYKQKFITIISLTLVVVGSLFFEYYNINNLPLVDFRSWKVGNRLVPENPKPVKYYLTYKHINSGEEQEFLSKDLPWQDSIFMAEWKWESSREEDPNITDMNIFPIIDAGGNDVSKELVSDKKFVFIFVIYDVEDFSSKLMPRVNNSEKISSELVLKMNRFYKEASDAGYQVVLLNSDLPEHFLKIKEENQLADFQIYSSDDTALKAAIRSNPGLIVVKSGVVMDKFHYKNIPDFKIFINSN